MKKLWTLLFFLIFPGCISLTAEDALQTSGKWWNNDWHFRVPVQSPVISSEIKDFPVKVKVNFSRLLGLIGKKGVFDEKSIRIIDPQGNEDAIIFDWVPAPSYDAIDNASGTLVWYFPDMDKCGRQKLYYIYFDIVENGPKNALPVQSDLPSNNFIKNPGFEQWNNNVPLCWSAASVPTKMAYETDKEFKRHGESSIRMTMGGFYSQKIPAAPGDCITASVYAKIKPKAGKNIDGTAIMHIVALNDQKKFISNVRGITLSRENPSWEKMEMLCSLPPKTAYAIIHLFVIGKNINAWFDDVVVQRLNIKEAKQIECINDIASISKQVIDGGLDIELDRKYYELCEKYAFIKINSLPLISSKQNEYMFKLELLKDGTVLKSEIVKDISEKIIPFEISSLPDGDYVFKVSLLDQKMEMLCSNLCAFSRFRGPFDQSK